MPLTCPNCQRELRDGMNFCPGCGLPLHEATGQGPTSGREGSMHFPGPALGPYPMPYMPGSYPYATPMSSRRAAGVAGGVLMIITASFVFLGGLVYIIESWWSDAWLFMASLSMLSFALAIVGAIGAFRRTWRLLALISCILMVVTAILSLFDLSGLAFITLTLASISTVLIAVSWPQFKEHLTVPGAYMPWYPGPMAGMVPPWGPPPAWGGSPPPAWDGAPPPASGGDPGLPSDEGDPWGR